MGNSLSGMFGGGSSAAPAEPTQATQAQAAQNNSSWGNNCAGATEQFTKCMDEQGGNMQICGWYLEQLVCLRSVALCSFSWRLHDFFLSVGLGLTRIQKACQAAAKQF